MKNDLDFIKKKIENSGVNAPKDMDEQYVAKTLEGVYPQPIAYGRPAPVQPPKRRGRRAAAIAISAVAAVMVLVITLGIIVKVMDYSRHSETVTLPGGLQLRQFRSHDEVTKELTRLKEKKDRESILQLYEGGDVYVEDYYMEDGEMAAGDGTKSGSSGASNGSLDASGSSGEGYAASDANGSAGGYDDSFSETYKQVEGVDEADVIKTDGRYIYCINRGYTEEESVIIFSADGMDPQKVAEIDVFSDEVTASPDEATKDEADRWEYYYSDRSIEDMYIKDDRLIVIYSDDTGYDGYVPGKAMTKIYDVSDMDHITLLDTYMQSGRIDSSRMIGDTLYLISSYTPYRDTELPICGRGEEPDEIPADCIYSLSDNDTEDFLVISAYDTLDHTAKTESKSILGRVDDIYCNLDHMYLYATHYEEKWYDRFRLYHELSEDTATTQILKVDLREGIDLCAYAEVSGVVDDQYAFDEYQGNLRVATTSQGQQDTNNLFVLDEDLTVIGSVNGFARDESIKAVRYVGDTAYVITYEQTDPLFVIDLSVPTAPMILGEAKITGFSTMLVPIDDNTLLGLGYHTSDGTFSDMEVQDGLKLVLFDVSDKLDPKVLDTMVYENCYSEVQYNPKALVCNADRGDYIIPLNYENWGSWDSYDSETGRYADEAFYGGVLNFKVENGKLEEIGYYKTDHTAIDRCVYVGDTVYMTYCDNNYELQIEAVPYKDN